MVAGCLLTPCRSGLLRCSGRRDISHSRFVLEMRSEEVVAVKSFVVALILSGGMCVSGTIDAQSHPDNVLVPVLLQEAVPGSRGSLWETEGFVYNDSDSDIALVYGIDFGLGHSLLVPAKTTVTLDLFPPGLPEGESVVPAYLLGITPERAGDLHFHLRVRDLSRQAATWGTEIPVVKMRDFTTEKIVLLNVPADDRFRRTLRLYHDSPPGNLLVSFYGHTSGNLLGQQIVHAGEINPNTTGPYYGERHDDLFPRAAEPLRIVIEPIPNIGPFWGFVSITHNETQHVTLITPQP